MLATKSEKKPQEAKAPRGKGKGRGKGRATHLPPSPALIKRLARSEKLYKCTLCGEDKRWGEFVRQNSQPKHDYIHPWCRVCMNQKKGEGRSGASYSPVEERLKRREGICANAGCGKSFTRVIKDPSKPSFCSISCAQQYSLKSKLGDLSLIFPDPLTTGKKFCAGCREVKSVDRFYKRTDCKDGLQNKCMKCQTGGKLG